MPSRDTSLRSQLAAAAARLREVDSPELAQAVETVLEPNGWGRLRRSAPAASGSGAGSELAPNLPIYMEKAVRDEINRNVAKAAEQNPGAGISVPAEAKTALEEFLAGRFVPEKLKWAAGSERANLNVRVDAGLRQRAEDFGADNAVKFEFAPRASHVIAAWLVAKYTTPKTAPAE